MKFDPSGAKCCLSAFESAYPADVGHCLEEITRTEYVKIVEYYVMLLLGSVGPENVLVIKTLIIMLLRKICTRGR